ncbi:hypothetical protein [Stenotrophomonas maltophilia]|uniref:hypothetical protein n=1 Tax=Stenotrophomonas maltophilia TaxID=40324 RepID=UPI001665BCB2|nr:hypothetical protein [Stenotrophomonas maltophilia]
MVDPNFSESQLQSAVNGALVRHAWEYHGAWLLPHVVSLWDEFDLGWDTAFVVPWFGGGHPDQDGCNLFIQYKLSDQLVSQGAAQWAHWNEPYYRFKIPHSTLGKSKKYIDDFHQWESLAKLAKAGYATFYATNSTLCKKELQAHYNAGELLDRIAWLDVHDVKHKKHRHVTFTPESNFFYLHSELEKVNRRPIVEVLIHLSEERLNESLPRANERLIAYLAEILEQEGSEQGGGPYRDELARIRNFSADGNDAFFARRVHLLLRSFVSRYLGATLLWIPRRTG